MEPKIKAARGWLHVQRRRVYFGLGHVALVASFIALIMPIVPMTPFLVLSAFFYDRSSKRFHNWLVNHRWLGGPIRRWHARPGLRMRTKVAMILLTVVMMGAYIHFVLSRGWMKVATALVGAAWLWFILLVVPTRHDGS